MPKRILPRLLAVSPAEKPLHLYLQWDNDVEAEVDISGLVNTFKILKPLQDEQLFKQVRLGEFRTDIVWNDEIDVPATTLWRLSQEQAGVTMSPEAFREWRERKAYTLDHAARALGLSRRIVAYYEQGQKPIPRVVALATRALELT